MNKFKVGDWVYSEHYQMNGSVETINDDGTLYDVVWDGGYAIIKEDDLVQGEEPDWRVIPEMNEKEFDEATISIIQIMRKEFSAMSMGDIQTVAMFSKIFKDEYLKEQI